MMPESFRPNRSLAAYSYALCGGTVPWLCECRTEAEYRSAAETCRREGIPFRVFGGLSNVLVSDEGWNGAVLLSRPGSVSVEDERITVSSGFRMSKLARKAAEAGLSGLEWAESLPGTVGGALYGNAGAFGSCMAELVSRVSLLDDGGTIAVLQPEELHFGYRTGALKEGTLRGCITSAVLTLRRDDPENIRARMEDYGKRRRNSQPHGYGSLGSVFRNPEGDSAGRLIESCGLKGARCGKASVSTVHANFIVTEKGVSAADYKTLMETVQDTVRAKTGILLVPEIELLGFGK